LKLESTPGRHVIVLHVLAAPCGEIISPPCHSLSLALFTADRSQFVFVNFDLFAAFGIMGNCGLLPMQIDFAK